MILEYFATNFITIMIMIALVVIMLVNRKLKIPATRWFFALISVVLILSVLDYMNAFLAGDLLYKPDFNPIKARTVVDTLSYILRPFVILIELLVILPERKKRLLCMIPVLINTVWYATALFGSKLAFFIDDKGWQSGIFAIQLVYVTQLVYLVLLAVCSVRYFGQKNLKMGMIISIIVLAALVTAFLEYRNILTGYATTVAAFCFFLYYIYLASVYQQEMQDLFEQKDLHIARQELLLVRSRIHSDFIFESLSIIRALSKTDKKAAAAAIDSFSFYLRAHLNAIRDDSPISFEWELDCVKAYLALLKIDKNESVELICDLQFTDFKLPQLLLETVADYCISHETDETILLKTYVQDEQVFVCLKGNGETAKSSGMKKEIQTARNRLKMQCGGTLETDGTGVVITVPKNEFSDTPTDVEKVR